MAFVEGVLSILNTGGTVLFLDEKNYYYALLKRDVYRDN